MEQYCAPPRRHCLDEVMKEMIHLLELIHGGFEEHHSRSLGLMPTVFVEELIARLVHYCGLDIGLWRSWRYGCAHHHQSAPDSDLRHGASPLPPHFHRRFLHRPPAASLSTPLRIGFTFWPGGADLLGGWAAW